jgi:hypothetical protein
MTQHRFIRSSPSVVLDTAYLGHNLHDARAFDAIQHWRRPTAESERGNAVHWYDHVRGIGEVGCCLSVDQGANGAVAHLTATAVPRRGFPKRLVRLALSSWSHRKLVSLARIAEAQVVDLGDVSEA